MLRAVPIISFIGLITPALAQQLTTLYRFPGGANGNFPRGGLAMDVAGDLYGTTRYDGNCSTCGIVYKLTPPAPGKTAWTYKVVHDFLLSGGGIDPISPLTAFNNVLYGTAAGGGDPMCGCGVIFSVTATDVYKNLHTFDPFVPNQQNSQWPQGTTPIGGLLIDSDGTMYGTTDSGGTGAAGTDGSNGAGIIYKISTGGSGFTKLHDFDGSLNSGPQGEMIFGADGAIYGTQYGGGKYNQGVIFRMTKAGSYQVLYDFLGVNQPGGSHDGAQPEGRLALGPDGTIYGTTSFGGSPSGYGTAWSIKLVNAKWVYTQLYIFGSAGNLPHSGLIMGKDGALYGTGAGGGAYQSGVIYRLLPPATSGGTWTYQLLHSFIGRDTNGDDPYGDLLYANDKFYGENLTGGDITDCSSAPGGCGTVFQYRPPHALHDFTPDARSDVLWRNTSSGAVEIWKMNGALAPSFLSAGSAATTWKIAGTGDFDDDGIADILWRNSNGQVVVWLMNGAQKKTSNVVGSAGSDWTIAGTGDFDGDNKTDILWHQTSTGNVIIWKMNGVGAPKYLNAGSATTDWQIAGVGDFDGDGMADILWRNKNNGQVAIWLMNGAQKKMSAAVGSATSDWKIVGVGDFDGDGKSDILWHQTSSGKVSIWKMNGVAAPKFLNAGSATTDWQIAGTGDFDGDGRSDILWRNSNGQVAVWLMNGAQRNSAKTIGSATSDWTIQPE